MVQLTATQQSIYNSIVDKPNGSIIGLRGYAGTGKTVTAFEILKNDRFNNVLITAPTGGALDVIRRKTQQDSDIDTSRLTYKTLAQFMKMPKQEIVLGDARFDVSVEGEMPNFMSMMMAEYQVDVSDFMKPMHRHDATVYLVDEDGINKLLGGKARISILLSFGDKSIEDVAKSLAPYDLVLCDEYSMVDQGTHKTVVKAVAFIEELVANGNIPATDPPLFLACGDDGQLPPVPQKGKSAIYSLRNNLISRRPDDNKIFLLTEQMRSTDEIGAMAIAVREGVHLSQIPEVVEANGSTAEIVYLKHKQVFRDSDVVLTFKNDTVNKLNKLLRKDKGFKGAVNANERLVNTQNVWFREPPSFDNIKPEPELLFATSEVLTVARVFSPDEAEEMIDEKFAEYHGQVTNTMNQAYQEVTDALLTGKVLMLEFTNGKIAMIEPRLWFKRDIEWQILKSSITSLLMITKIPMIDANFAYAMTVHKSQGSEFENVVYLVNGVHVKIQRDKIDGIDWRAPYTAITRAKSHLTVIYSDKGDF